MAQSAELIACSIGHDAKLLATFRIRYPKFIHGECLTHRLLEQNPEVAVMVPDGVMYDQDMSRNASSSRATPVARMIDEVMRDPVVPMHWGKNQKGMQAREELQAESREQAIKIWLEARDDAVRNAQRLNDLGAHKQIVNRIIEPWMHIITVVTATEWNNFFALRCHPDAQPEINDLAWKMKILMDPEKAVMLSPNNWHLPFVTPDDYHTALDHTGKNRPFSEINSLLCKISAARCARVSYYNFHGTKSTVEEDIQLFDKLTDRDTVHASPLEHQAKPDVKIREQWVSPQYHGNLRGWIQHRKLVANESVPG